MAIFNGMSRPSLNLNPHQCPAFPLSDNDLLSLILAETRVELESIITVFVAGSYAEGFANAFSDFDVYYIVQGSQAAGYIFQPDIRAEFICLPLDVITSLGCALEAAENTQGKLAPNDKWLIQRVLSGVPIYNPEAFFELKKHLSENHFLACSAMELFKDCINNHADIRGATISGDLDTAVLQCDQLLGLSFDLYLTLSGVTNYNSKWRLRRALRVLAGTNTILQKYVALTAREKFVGGRKDRVKFIDESLMFYQIIESEYLRWYLARVNLNSTKLANQSSG